VPRSAPKPRADRKPPAYQLESQIGFMLRQAFQRHTTIFATLIHDELTSTQWAVVSKLNEVGDCSQNQLGRLTAMDVANIKGVVERLARRGFVSVVPDLADRRRLTVALTDQGRDLYKKWVATASLVSAETLAPLSPEDRETLIRLIKQII
jgi:DNA-binding MarR family transcriptional regulator